VLHARPGHHPVSRHRVTVDEFIEFVLVALPDEEILGRHAEACGIGHGGSSIRPV
jgi:hypothetical protein